MLGTVRPFAWRIQKGPPPGAPSFKTIPATRTGRSSKATSASASAASPAYASNGRNQAMASSTHCFFPRSDLPSKASRWRANSAHRPSNTRCSSFRSAMSRWGTTLSMFRIRMNGVSTPAKFFNKAPCPPGRKSSEPSACRACASASMSQAKVSVDGDCTDVVMWSLPSQMDSMCAWYRSGTVKCSGALPAKALHSVACSSKEDRLTPS